MCRETLSRSLDSILVESMDHVREAVAHAKAVGLEQSNISADPHPVAEPMEMDVTWTKYFFFQYFFEIKLYFRKQVVKAEEEGHSGTNSSKWDAVCADLDAILREARDVSWTFPSIDCKVLLFFLLPWQL